MHIAVPTSGSLTAWFQASLRSLEARGSEQSSGLRDSTITTVSIARFYDHNRQDCGISTIAIVRIARFYDNNRHHCGILYNHLTAWSNIGLAVPDVDISGTDWCCHLYTTHRHHGWVTFVYSRRFLLWVFRSSELRVLWVTFPCCQWTKWGAFALSLRFWLLFGNKKRHGPWAPTI